MNLNTRVNPSVLSAPADESGGSSGGGGFFANLFGGGGGGGSIASTPVSSTPVSSTPVPSTPVDTPPAAADTVDPATLDGFARLLVNSKQGNDTATGKQDDFDLASIASNPAAITALAAKRDFTSDLPAEIQGGLKEGNVDAIMAAIQHASRNAYQSALQHALQLASKSNEATTPKLLAEASKLVEQRFNQRDLRGSLPTETHPATNLVLESVAQGLMAKVPGMSPQQAAQAAQSLLRDMAGQLAAKDQTTTKPSNKAWDDWFAV